MKKYIYLLMMGFFFAAFQVAEVEAQRGDPGMDRGRGDPGMDRGRRDVSPEPRGPANPPDRRRAAPADTRDPRAGGAATAPDDRPWRAILKNCRQMKARGEKLTKPMRQECKRARAMKKGRR